jgi:serine/threonine protein kinase
VAGQDPLLAGRYRIVRRLGIGGMGRVDLAHDERLGREVAVKRLHLEGGREDAVRRLRREARIGAGLSHPALVTVFDVLSEEEDVVVVMEYVEGETLAAALRRGPLGPARTLAVLAPVADALDRVHAAGAVHRDVKPANILLGARGVAKLADLGIASAADGTQITRSGSVLGTPAYVAPEQLDAVPVGPRADVYALAAVAFEALSGRRARAGDTPLELVRRAVDDPPPDLAALGAGSTAVAAVLKRGLCRDPAGRPASAGALVDELRGALALPERAVPTPAPTPEPPTTEEIAASPPVAEQLRPLPLPPPPPTARPRRPRTPLLAAAGVLVAAGAIVAVVLGTSADRGPETTSRAAGPSTTRSTSTSAPAHPPAAPGPTQTVRAFYTRAARKDFAGSWRLAGPRMRAAFGRSEARYARDRNIASLQRITFRRLEETARAADSATVAISTRAEHTDHVDLCTGTVTTLRQADGSWRVDPMTLTCRRG